MQQVKKVVLAYSGGVDTSVCIPYLKNEYGISEVVTYVADLCLLYTSPSPRDRG